MKTEKRKKGGEGEAYPRQLRGLVLLPNLPEVIVLLLLQVGLPLDLCLVEPVDDGVLALGDEDAADAAGVLEADLADLHGAVLAEVGPGGVDDGDVVLLVALDGVGLGELGEVGEEGLGEGFPGPGGRGGGGAVVAVAGGGEAEVDVCRGELVSVEPDVFFPAVLDEVFVCGIG